MIASGYAGLALAVLIVVCIVAGTLTDLHRHAKETQQ